jgi:hypothetical protein
MKTMLRTAVFTPVMIWTLVVTTFVIGWFPPEGGAMLAPVTPAGLVSDASRTDDLQRVQRALENKLVQQRLADYGLTPEEINARLARLSDAQLHNMAAQIDALMPGGDGGLGIVIALLVIAILAVILIYLLGHRIEVKKN